MSAHIFLGCILAAAVAGEASTVEAITKQGVDLGNLSAAAIWATISLVTVLALVRLYFDQKKGQEDLKNIIKDSSACIQKNSDTLDKLASKIDSCPKK